MAEAIFKEIINGQLEKLCHYSTDIVDAWKVVEKLKLSLIPLPDNKWFCGTYDIDCEYLDCEDGIIDGHFTFYCIADTVTLAICFTALLIMEE